MYPVLGGLSAACTVALQLVNVVFPPRGVEGWSDGGRGLEGWSFPPSDVTGMVNMVIYISRGNMNNKPDGHQTNILKQGKEATVGRAQTVFWLPPSSNAIGPESSRATFKMPSTLLHREWIGQLAVRWLTPPVVDVLERGAYTSPLTRAVLIVQLATLSLSLFGVGLVFVSARALIDILLHFTLVQIVCKGNIGRPRQGRSKFFILVQVNEDKECFRDFHICHGLSIECAWGRNIRQTCEFIQALLSSQGDKLLVEPGQTPHPDQVTAEELTIDLTRNNLAPLTDIVKMFCND
ncbi:hypothetical protein B0H13DRAFT_1850735 [Mycena leptocephala]|nr:hypothetical protein B0H13DRAFT_1850735 [Mycena leptocephala]